jgi:hypothetical protein
MPDKVGSMDVNIIFVLGPSGAGKSDLSKALAEALNYEFYEIDRPADGIDTYGLRAEWDEFLHNNKPTPLVELLRARAEAVSKGGIILAFSSLLILGEVHIDALGGLARVVYLYGREGQCLDAFLERERHSGRGLDMRHWAHNNTEIFRFLSSEEAKPHLVAAFDEGGRRSLEQVLADIQGAT